ncbi:MAG: ABC transporter ATP-binding protein [Nitrospinota bacterium]
MRRMKGSSRNDFVAALGAVFQLSRVGWTNVGLLLALIVLATLSEGFGVAMLFPVLQYIEQGGNLQVLLGSSAHWKYLIGLFQALSIPISLATLSGLVLLLLLLRQGFNYAKTVYNSWLAKTILLDIRSRGFDALLRADIGFHERVGTGKAISALTLDGERASGAVFTFFKLVSTASVFIAYLTLLAVLSPGMTLFAALVMGSAWLILRARVKWCRDYGKEISDHNESMARSMSERTGGIRVIKLAGSESRETANFNQVAARLRDLGMNVVRIVTRVEAIVDPLVVAAGLCVLYVAAEVYGMSISKIGIFLLVLLRLLPYAKDMLKSRQNLAGFMGSLNAVSRVLAEALQSDVIRGGIRAFARPQQAISFVDVRFSYAKDAAPALRHVTLSIPAGRMTALVGPSGAGKSTLVDLIPRLREPQEGRILIDGIAIEEYSLADLRRAIAFVPQDSFLFDNTVASNIRYVCPEASLNEVQAAARAAHADDFIQALPEGYETRIGERGVRLSGGERQRIVLARALLQRAPIVVLDEPTSALDSESEHYIQQAVAEIRAKGQTTLIVIAHRLSTIKTADRIVILDRGQVVGSGSHHELMDEVDWYAGIVSAQAAV